MNERSMILNVLLFVDRSVPMFNDLAASIMERVHVVSSHEADLAIVLQKPKDARETLRCIPLLPVLRLEYLRLYDTSICAFANTFSGLPITHIDMQLSYNGMNLKREAVGLLFVADVKFCRLDNVKFSVNLLNGNQALHIVGSSMDLSLSCFVSNESNHFEERITVYTATGDVFRLSPPGGHHTYIERYDAALGTLLEQTPKNENLSKELLKIDRALRFGGCGAGRPEPRRR